MKTFKIPKLALLPIILAAALTLTSFDSDQSSFISKLKAKLNTYLGNYNEEKIYVQTDKTLYKPGEYIFFNAFLTDAVTGKPSTISDVAYVEIYDGKGNLWKKAKLNMAKGSAGSEVFIDYDIPGGLYSIKAYTKWMLNFGDNRCFTKEFQIQKVITPRLLLTTDFQKKAYGKGDKVIADLKVSDLKNEKAANASVNVKINIDGKLYKQFNTTTDKEGNVAIEFDLPNDLNTTDVLMQALVTYKGTEESISRSVPVVLDKIALKFFPEGGTWANGTESRIAFEALNEFGKGADISGEILDENGTKISDFESYHFGMGAFTIKGNSNNKYYAKITKPAGNNTLFPLPLAKNDYVLNLKTDNKNSLTWSIHAPKAGNAYLALRVHGQLLGNKNCKLQSGNNTVEFNVTDLPFGIGVFTLFDENGVARCERLVMLNTDRRLNIKVSTDKNHYQPREEVTAEIETTDHNGKPVETTMAVAVVDEQILTMADDKQDNILTYAMLSSELEGKIHEPSFYFNNKEKKSDNAVDYLLLTHGWRTFTWNDVLTPQPKNMSMPESTKRGILGYIVNKNGKPVSAEVYAFEMNNLKRGTRIKTEGNGQFAFLNTNSDSPVILFTKKPNKIKLLSESNNSTIATIPVYDNDNEDKEMLLEEFDQPAEIEAEVEIENMVLVVDNIPHARIAEDRYFDDNAELSEVVVVGYGVARKSALMGSVASIVVDAPKGQHLLGNGRELQVFEYNISPGNAKKVMVRGYSSVVNNNSPLIIVNGVVTNLNSNNFNSLGNLNIENIQSLEIVKDAAATALYGARGANGAIVITTRTNGNFPYRYKIKREEPLYSYTYSAPKIQNFVFDQSQSYYQLMPLKTTDLDKRTDFRTTVYWSRVQTDATGKAKIKYYNNESNSAFRITAEGISLSGLTGRTEYTYHTSMPLSLDVKLPNYMNYTDVVNLNVVVRNNSDKTLSPKLNFTATDGLILEGDAVRNVTVEAGMAKNIVFTVKSAKVAGKFPIEITLADETMTDVMKHELEVYPVGFPYSKSISGKDAGKSETFNMSDIEPGSFKGVASVHLNMAEELFAGADAILREPYGCFEQVSSSTFPNIFVMQLMDATDYNDYKMRERALSYIKTGYKRLTAYEIPTGGFEWFGNPPANEALTAYGLVEFVEMSKIYNGVSTDMIQRTTKWLLERRNPDGTFIQSRGGFDYLSSAPYNVNCAYVVYALSEVNADGLDKSYQIYLNEAQTSKDLYRMALMAMAAKNMDKESDFEKLESELKNYINKKNINNIKVESTIVRSGGRSAVIETTALIAAALMRSNNPDHKAIEKCIDYITSCRSSYGYGSTQATSLALKALTEYAINFAGAKTNGMMELLVNGEKQQLPFTENDRTVTNESFVNNLKEGKNDIKVSLNADVKVPYSVVINWSSSKPESSAKCPLLITTQLAQSEVKLNETVRMTVKLKNKEKNGQPMSIAVVGIPAGLSPQPWQLKELQEKGVFDYYEISGNRLAFFYRSMGANSEKTINLDLKADIAGKYSGAASSGYLYYTQEERHWVKGMDITITN